MFGEPVVDCQSGKEEELELYKQGQMMLEEISVNENRAITIDDINRVCDELGIN
jgi:hypothetical protein